MTESSTAASEFYPARHASLETAAAAVARRAARLLIALWIFGAITLGLILLTLRTDLSSWLILIPFLIAGFVLNRYLRTRREGDRLLRLIHLYDRALGRIDGSQPQSGHTGEGFRPAEHLYDRDLTILGPESLFGMLATVRTGVGQRGLARDLLHLPGREQTLERQAAIQELAPRNDLREQIHLLGVSEFQQVAASFFDTWLADPPPIFHPAVRISLVITTTAYLLLTLAGVFHLAAWSILRPNIFAILAIQAAIAMSVRKRVVPVLDASSQLSNQMAMFSDGLAILQGNRFSAPRLVALQAISTQPHNAVPLLAAVQRQFVVVEQRTKNISLVLSLFLSVGTHAAISIADWKRKHAASMQQWLSAWAEFESLNALATYAYEHPENLYPEILPTGTALFEASALAHPLLPANAVANDIALNASASLYIISGSNMAGKSTLLRAIGLNAVLAAVGAPIRVTAARISPLDLGASLALTDSLAEGKSKFLAEVERLHAILKTSAGPVPVLFLIDEIFSGTNSLDRRVAAEAIARALIANHAIGALSTHDLTLTGMAEDDALHAINVHMASPDAADPLAFDYMLKPGVNPSSNALAILRLVGIGVDA